MFKKKGDKEKGGLAAFLDRDDDEKETKKEKKGKRSMRKAPKHSGRRSRKE